VQIVSNHINDEIEKVKLSDCKNFSTHPFLKYLSSPDFAHFSPKIGLLPLLSPSGGKSSEYVTKVGFAQKGASLLRTKIG
jgi:hypothetical protein